VRGSGKSRRAAEQLAAKHAFEAAYAAVTQAGRRSRKQEVPAAVSPAAIPPNAGTHGHSEAAVEANADGKAAIDDAAHTAEPAER